jgi:hypothetical protein
MKFLSAVNLFLTFVILASSLATATFIASDAPYEINISGPPGWDPERVIVVSKNTKGLAQAEAASSQVFHRWQDAQGRMVVAGKIPSQAQRGLQNNPNIESLEVDAPRYHLAMPSQQKYHKHQLLRGNATFPVQEDSSTTRHLAQDSPYGIAMVQADQVNYIPGKKKICIIDSGYAVNHPDLPDLTNAGYPSTWNSDTCAHGSHVAGTIAAMNNAEGVIGVIPDDTDIFVIKVFDGTNCAWSYSSSLVDAANRCANNGANVISMSLGGAGSTSSELNAFQTLYNNGILSIAAAGNDGDNSFSYPASYDVSCDYVNEN